MSYSDISYLTVSHILALTYQIVLLIILDYDDVRSGLLDVMYLSPSLQFTEAIRMMKTTKQGVNGKQPIKTSSSQPSRAAIEVGNNRYTPVYKKTDIGQRKP